jgi:hypothetical protein
MAACAIPSAHALEQSDNLEDFPREPLEGGDDFCIESCDLAKGYKEGRLSVVLQFAIRRDGSAVAFPSHQDDIRYNSSPVFMLQLNSHDPADGYKWDQEFVFVVDVKGVDEKNVLIPSLVRFYPVEEKVTDGVGSRYFSTIRERGFKFLPCPLRVDGESGVFGRPFAAELANDLDPRDIKCGMEVVNCISDAYGKACGQLVISVGAVEVLLPGLKVEVGAGAMAVSRNADSVFYLRDVLIGPFDFEMGMAKRRIPDFRHE